MSAGRGSRLGWADEERDAGDLLLQVSAQIREGSLSAGLPGSGSLSKLTLGAAIKNHIFL